MSRAFVIGVGVHLLTPLDSTKHPAPALQFEAGQRVLNAIDGQLLYARVDFVILSPDTPGVIEVELIEPSLYFAFDERSPDRFAHVLDRIYRAH